MSFYSERRSIGGCHDDLALAAKGRARSLAAASALILAGALSGLAACDGGESDSAAASSSSSSGSQSVCAGDPRAMAYAVGLEAASSDGSVKVRFVESTPAPPSKGNNSFRIQLLDSSGAAIDGATITTKPFMPDHGHGSSSVPQTTPAGSGGEYGISPVTLFMPGIWNITFTIDRGGAPTQSVVFTFCVDG